MKKFIKIYTIAFLLLGVSMQSFAQQFYSAYFTDGFLYRHQINPAVGNDSVSYIAVPVIGNLSVSQRGNIGIENVLQPNPLYPAQSDKKLTTFMNPYLDNPLGSFHKGINRLESNFAMPIISTGFRAWGGYNTLELNVRSRAQMAIPYELFEMACKTTNKRYELGNIGSHTQTFSEVALGHSRDINNKWRVGAKLKVLVGIADAEIKLNNVVADLQNDQSWRIQADNQVDVSITGFEIETTKEQYKQQAGSYEVLKNYSIKNPNVGGWGIAADVGTQFKLNRLCTLSASLIDIGFINWKTDIRLANRKKEFVFNGFHDIDVASKNNNEQQSGFEKKQEQYADQLAQFANLEPLGDKGARTTTIGATLNLGAQYALPYYQKLTFGLLSTTRMAGRYSWTEGRLSANIAPVKWLSAGVNVAISNFGTTMGTVLNLHPKGINLFIGANQIPFKLSKRGIPLNSNLGLDIGCNIVW